MCGIAGYLGFPVVRAEPSWLTGERLEAMLGRMVHRGPDDWGMALFSPEVAIAKADPLHITWIPSPQLQLGLGHRRLSILDLSPAGHQPMTTAEKDLWITFNGEIYNYIELRAELARYTTFRTGTDTEVLLAAYRAWGHGMFQRLDGMYAFALWDAKKETLLCARDPMGIKPFYYYLGHEQFLFASEPKAVLAGLRTAGHADMARIAEFLVLGISDYDEGTSYLEVKQLRGGQWLEISPKGATRLQTFWQPSQSVLLNEVDIPTLVRDTLDLAVRRQLRADVPVGTCLSGGLDSGSIAASIHQQIDTEAVNFQALTLVNNDFDGDESELARLTAEHSRVSWQAVKPEQNDLSEDVRQMISLMDEPFGSLSILGQYKVMQRARQLHLKVMLDGQGGDEVFLGYPRLAQFLVGEYFFGGDIRSAIYEWRALRRNASQSLFASVMSNAYFRLPRLAVQRNRMRVRNVIDLDFLNHLRLEIADDLYGAKNLYEMQVKELTRYVLPSLLRYEDRNSMAFGVEARVPLLALNLVDLGLRLPAKWKVRDGWTKYALRKAMEQRLPLPVLWCSRKRGFEVPQRRWLNILRPHLAEWLKDLPQDFPINADAILGRIDGKEAQSHWFWRCLSVSLWVRFSGVQL